MKKNKISALYNTQTEFLLMFVCKSIKREITVEKI